MMNIQGIMKQAQAMQKKMEEMQEKLAQEEVTGTSGGGMVSVVLNGKYEIKKQNTAQKRQQIKNRHHGNAKQNHSNKFSDKNFPSLGRTHQ